MPLVVVDLEVYHVLLQQGDVVQGEDEWAVSQHHYNDVYQEQHAVQY